MRRYQNLLGFGMAVLLAPGAGDCAGVVFGQGPPQAGPPRLPETAAADPQIAQALEVLTGTFVATEDNGARLEWRSAPFRVGGFPGAVYYEIARADSPAAPFRQGVIQPFRRQGQLQVRFFELVGEPGLKGALVGLWAAPDAYPPLPSTALLPTHDVIMVAHPRGMGGRTGYQYPTTRDGAIELSVEMSLEVGPPPTIKLAERGFDAAGRQVWGPGFGGQQIFQKTPSAVEVSRRPSGLVVIDLVAGDESQPASVEGGNIAVHYTGWRTDGFQFETSRAEGRQPLRTRIPGTGIPGVDEALVGMRVGMVRRVVIPPELAFGEEGSVRGRIPPNATLIYEFEAVEVQNPVSPVEPPARPAPAADPSSSSSAE